jgi:hypothetical protein
MSNQQTFLHELEQLLFTSTSTSTSTQNVTDDKWNNFLALIDKHQPMFKNHIHSIREFDKLPNEILNFLFNKEHICPLIDLSQVKKSELHT